MAGKLKITIEIDGDSKGAQAAIGGVSAGTVALGNIMAQVATQAVQLLGESIKFMTGEIMKSVSAASQSQQSQSALAAVMKNAGIYTKDAFKANIDYATSLQAVSTYSDEEINGVQKQLIAFGLQGKVLDDTVVAVMDLAQKTGDLSSAGDLVARTIGTTTNALARQGIQVSDVTDKELRAQQVVEGITRLYGGQATAAASTFGGQIKTLTNLLDDFYEEVGYVIINSDAMKTVFVEVKNAVLDMTKYVQEHKKELNLLVTEGIAWAIEGISLLIKTIAFVSEAWHGLGTIVRSIKFDFAAAGKGIAEFNEIVTGLDNSVATGAMEQMKQDLATEGEAANLANQQLLLFVTTTTDALDGLAKKIRDVKPAYQEVIDYGINYFALSMQEMTTQVNDNTQELINLARGYTDEELTQFETRKTALQQLLADNKITQQQYNDWLLKEGKKVNSKEAKRLSEMTILYNQMFSTITSVSKTQSDLVVKDKKNSMAALEDAFKGSLSQMLDMAVDYAVKEIGVTAALESGKAAAMGFLSFGTTLLLIPLIAAAATAAKAIIHSVAGFAGGGMVGPGGVKMPLPSFASTGSGAPAMAMVHEGEAIGTPAVLAASGIGGITVYFNNYGGIGSDVDVDNLGQRLAENIKNGLRGAM